MSLPDDLQLRLVETWEDAEAYMQWLSGLASRNWPIGCDTETGGLNWWRQDLRVIQFGDEHNGWTIPYEAWGGLAEETFRRWQGDIIFHNAKFDLHYLESNGFEVGRHRVHDSMLLAKVLDPHLSAGLKPCSDRWVDRRASAMSKSLDLQMMKHKWDWDTVPIKLPEYWAYAALDPVLTMHIWNHEQKHSRRWITDHAYLVDLGSAMFVLDMEQRGQPIDHDYCEYWATSLVNYADRLDAWTQDVFGAPPLSKDNDLIKYFQSQGVTFTKFTDKGNISIDKDSLESINHPLAEHVIAYRQATKQAGTYFQSWLDFADDDSRLHPSFWITGARTGRMSCSDPNLQNVPRSRRVRNGLVPKEGNVLVLADYDQIELRLMAHFSQSKPMIQAIHSGEDLHTYTAKLVYQVDEPTKEQRRIAKSSNFAKIYGAGIQKFADTAGTTFDEAKSFLAGYDREFPEVRGFQAKISDSARASAAESDDGLAHLTSEYINRQQVADPAQAYKLVNYLIQGTATDVLKMKMLDLGNTDLGDYTNVLIHDEIAFEVPKDEAEDFAKELPSVMEEHDAFDVPLSVGVEIVDRWGDKYEEDT